MPVTDTPALRQFEAFNRPLRWLSALFALIYLAAGAVLGNAALLACGALAFGLVASCLVAQRFSRSGRMVPAALCVAFGLMGIALSYAFLLPFVFPTLVMMPIAAVALTLTYLSGKPLRLVIAAAFCVSVTAAVAGMTMRDTVPLPPALRVFVTLSTIAIDVGLTMVLLWQFSSRLRQTTVAAEDARAVAESNERSYRALAESIPQQVWTSDVAGHLDYVNARVLAYFGRPSESILGEGWVAMLHDDDLPESTRRWARSLATGERYEVEFRLRRHDGEYRWHLGRAEPVRDSFGRVVKWFGTNTDITDAKHAQALLMEESRRKDEFLAMLGHELRNPLAPVLSAVEVLKASRGLAEDPRLATIERQARNMSRLVDDLLDVSRISGGKIQLRRELLDLREPLGASIEVARPLMTAREHTFEVRLPSEPVPVEGDPTRLEQVFSNLLQNAAKYTEPGGRIEVTLRVVGTWVLVQVTDNGIGMAKEFLPRAFELFSQQARSLERSQGGLGLGLTLVRRLAAMHGGTAEAQSEGPGQGSQFTVRLPLDERQLPARGRPEVTARPGARPERILVVDDNVDAAQMLCELISLWGHEVDCAHDGDQALAVLANGLPGMALLDIGLPGMSGYELAGMIRALPGGEHVRLIAITGYGQSEDRQRARAAGFDLHLTKPIEPELLLQVIADQERQRPTG